MKLIVRLLILLLGFSLVSCAAKEIEEESILDSLKISAWVLDEDFEATGYYTYDSKAPYYGCWMTDNGDSYSAEEVFGFERLETGKPRVMAPMGYNYMDHVNLHLDCDGIVEVEVSDEGDPYVRIFHSLDSPEKPWYGNRIAGNFRAIAPLVVEINPIGKHTPNSVGHRDTLVDKEYYINIRTYDYDGTQVIAAKIKFTVLEDEAYPYEDIYFPIYGPNEERSRFLSVELVEYEFSDQYKFDEELVVTD